MAAGPSATMHRNFLFDTVLQEYLKRPPSALSE